MSNLPSNLLPGIQGLLPNLGQGMGNSGLQGLLQGASPAGPSGSPLLSLLSRNPALLSAAAAVTVRPASNAVDPDVQELCDHFHIEDRLAKRLSDLMRNRQETFEQDLQKLWEVLETARGPAGLLTVKMREMEEGSFIGKAIPDKELEAMEGNSGSTSRHCRNLQMCSHDDLRRGRKTWRSSKSTWRSRTDPLQWP